MDRRSWEVDSYQEGNWRISVRHNLENDRMDEGDFPDGFSIREMENAGGQSKTYQVYMDDRKVAEVKGIDPETRIIIPMIELTNEEEEQFHQFLDKIHKI